MFKRNALVLIVTLMAGTVFAGNTNPTAPFVMTYSTNTPDSVKLVVDSVAKVWAQYIKSTLPIRVSISWKSQDQMSQADRNVGASAKPSSYTIGITNKKESNIAYPIALAEKLSGRELNNGESDMIIFIPEINLLTWDNHYVKWYYGLDGKVPSYHYELFTLLLHEFAHGLGLNSAILLHPTDATKLSFGGTPTIYDVFIKNEDNISLTSFSDGNDLFKAATNPSKLYFVSPYTLAANKNNKPLLQVFDTYKPSSSICHLDEKLYPAGDPNSLMTFEFDYKNGESIHTPGSLALAMIASIGWSDVYLSFTKPNNKIITTDSTRLAIKTSKLFANDKIKLIYSYDNFVSEQNAILKPNGSNDSLIGYIKGNGSAGDIKYYISAMDTSSNTIKFPVDAPSSYYSFHVGIDNTAPEIEHTPFTVLTNLTPSIEISAVVYDNIGIDKVELLYASNDTATISTQTMTSTDGGFIFKFKVPTSAYKDSKTFFYKIIAFDAAGNKATSPNGAFVKLDVQKKRLTYINDFSDLSTISDFLIEKNKWANGAMTESNKNTGFWISDTVKGFDNNGALHTDHPYDYAEHDVTVNDIFEKSINYIAQLNFPITLQKNAAYLYFDEVVLVEPGEPGVAWGDYGFFDYIIVEGSKDTKNWYPFEFEGYDSRKELVWENQFNSIIKTDEGDRKKRSMLSGNKDLYRQHTINLLGNKFLRAGDDVYFRFRLYSDRWTIGWGWAIDNLKIQPNAVITDCKELTSAVSCDVFPNPAADEAISVRLDGISTDVQLQVVSNTGIISYSAQYAASENGIYSISQNFASGLYTVLVISEGQLIASSRFVVIK